jgi:hypothetical protein
MPRSRTQEVLGVSEGVKALCVTLFSQNYAAFEECT